MWKLCAKYMVVVVGLLSGVSESTNRPAVLSDLFFGDPFPGAIEIIAHRGSSAQAPENTMAAVRLAWKQGCSAVEVDVRLSRDERIVAIHDVSTRRTGGVNWSVARTSSEKLGQLDVGRHKGIAFAGERIPLLSEVLDSVPEDRRLFIDVKCGEVIIPFLKTEIVQSGKVDQVVVISFDLNVLTHCKTAMPEVPAYWLRDTWVGQPHRTSLIHLAQAAGVDGLDVHDAGVTPNFVHQTRASGLDLYVWTVDSLSRARQLIRMGVQGLTTNDPVPYRTYKTDHVNDISDLYTGRRLEEAVPDGVIQKLYEEPFEVEPADIDLEPFLPNEYMILRNDNRSALAVYDAFSHKVKHVEKTPAYGIIPRNAQQIFALDALCNTSIKLVSLSGKAGTGKTLLALAAALENRKKYRQIWMARPIVPLSNKDLGYLPGDVFQIDHPYLNSHSNGLSYLIDKMKGQRIYAHVTLEKGEQSELADIASNLL